MKRAAMILSILAGALAQLFLPAWPVFGGAKPPVLPALVLYYALRLDEAGMWTAAFWAALLADGLSLGPFGPALLGFPLIARLAYAVRNDLFIDGLVAQAMVGAAGAALAALVAVLVYAIDGQRPLPFGHVALRLVGSGLMGAVALALVSHLFGGIAAAIPKRRRPRWQ
jgi:rod shape-determining protein MreD